MHTLIALLCVLLPTLVQSINFPPVPIQYVTESDITSKPKEEFIFSLKTCGGTQFDHFNANVFVNVPDRKWNPTIGDFVSVVVKDSFQHVVGQNIDSKGNYITNSSFLYHKEGKDLLLYVTSGNAPDIKYTLTVTFTKILDAQKPEESRHALSHRYVQTEEEIFLWQKASQSYPKENAQDLVTVFKTTITEVVDTADIIGLQLGYCFNPLKFPGSIDISVLSTDEVSGFATYACTADIVCNSTEAAKYSDVSGSSVNFVTVELLVPENAGPIDVLVRGDGRFNGKNNFNLAASKFKQKPNPNSC